MDPEVEKRLSSAAVSAHEENAGVALPLDHEAEPSSPEEIRLRKKLIFKLDLIFLPLLALAYLAAYMDRNNIANAALMNFKQDLGLSAQKYYNAVMVYYAGYLALVFPANLLIYRLGPQIQLGSCVALFGLFVCCMCAARGYADVVGLRFGIGACEALLQATPIYGVYWYSRHEFGKRIAIFYSAATLSGVFSGLMAYGIQENLEIPGKRPAWQWLYIIEGCFAIALGLCMVALLPNFPNKLQKSWIFTQEEIKHATSKSSALKDSNSVKLWQVRRSLLDPKTYFLAFLAATNSTLLASIGAFLPTVVSSFGFSHVQAQLFSIIPYSVAFVSTIVVGILSDRYRNKGFFILGALTFVLVGLIVLISTSSKYAGMVGATLLAGGAYPASVLQIAWIAISFAGYTKRAVSWGIAMIFGQGFSMLGSQIYTTPPRFFKGHGTLLGLVAWAMIMTVCAQWYMGRANRKRDVELEDYRQRDISYSQCVSAEEPNEKP